MKNVLFILVCIVIFSQFQLITYAGEGDTSEAEQAPTPSSLPCGQSYNPYIWPPSCPGHCPIDYYCAYFSNGMNVGCACVYEGQTCTEDSECPYCKVCRDSKCVKGGQCVISADCPANHTCEYQNGNVNVCNCVRPPTLEERCNNICGGGPSFTFVSGGQPQLQCIGAVHHLEGTRYCCCGTSPLFGGGREE